jgi:hypothetical protein
VEFCANWIPDAKIEAGGHNVDRGFAPAVEGKKRW